MSFLKPLPWDEVLRVFGELVVCCSAALGAVLDLGLRGSSWARFSRHPFWWFLGVVLMAVVLAGDPAPTSLGEGIGFPSGSYPEMRDVKARLFFPFLRAGCSFVSDPGSVLLHCNSSSSRLGSRWLSPSGKVP